jgi:hypothetical protein
MSERFSFTSLANAFDNQVSKISFITGSAGIAFGELTRRLPADRVIPNLTSSTPFMTGPELYGILFCFFALTTSILTLHSIEIKRRSTHHHSSNRPV